MGRLSQRLHDVVHREHHDRTGFDQAASESYHRRATRLLAGFYRRVADDVVAVAGPKTVVVDVGTGPGLMLHHLASTDLVLHGVDPSADMVAVARKAAVRAGLAERMAFAVGEAARLPFDDGSVDVLVSSLSLHHWPDHDAAAAEARRVLRPGGRLLAFDFRFVPMDTTRQALRDFTDVTRTPLRLLFARLSATR